ncbi:MAG TPA: phosphopantetheine-binding protein, partial [Nannocystaceae bacterium]|nr:phosphopantetheine-binding protein [Nannocystaceae bacterium]
MEFEGFVIRLLAELQGLAEREVDPRASFRGLGLDSLGASRLAARLSEALGRPLSPTLVWEFPTISALARHLAGAPGAAEGGAAAATSEDPGEPIAIIGVACRVPGAASPAAFWELLA